MRVAWLRGHKTRLLLQRNQSSTLFAEGYTLNVIVTYNLWVDHRLIVVYQNRPRQIRRNKLGAVVGLQQCVKQCCFANPLANP